MRIGIDLGGTKIEALALDEHGTELLRYRIDSPQGDYQQTLLAMSHLVSRIEEQTGETGTVGAGIPGSVSGLTGMVKNANSTWLNGHPIERDLSLLLGREVRVANDANCLAVSEATDGAAEGQRVVFGVILGTGAGGGVALNGTIHAGPNGLGGEWGHNPLPWPEPDEFPGPPCYCGKRGCIETWVSGTGMARSFREATGRSLTAREIVAAAEQGAPEAVRAVERFEDRLARALAGVVNILDPDVFVFGGGVSRVSRLYQAIAAKLPRYVFGGECDTPLLPARFGDASGVRGAAWLWPPVR